jgi:hypothetical protein
MLISNLLHESAAGGSKKSDCAAYAWAIPSSFASIASGGVDGPQSQTADER